MLTIYLGKLLGLYCIAIAIAMMAKKQGMLTAIDALLRNPALLLVVDIINIAIGLALVIGHNVWTGGWLALAITLIGWASLVKGLVFICLSQERMLSLYAALRWEKNFNLYMGATLVLGLCLAGAAFNA